MLLDSRSHISSPSPKSYDKPSLASSDTSESSSESHDSDPAFLATCSVPSASLLVTNLPTLLFSQAQDLHPLFFPFGHIEKLEIVQVSPLGTMSVVVRYSAAHVAQEAKEALSGQLYGSYQIEARYVKPIGSNLFDLSTTGLMTADRKPDRPVSTPGDFSGQPRVLDDHCTGRMKDLAHTGQFGLGTGLFFHRAISLPMPPPSLPSAFSGNFQDCDSSRLTSVDSRFVYFVRLLLLPILFSEGGTPTKDTDLTFINVNSLCRIKYSTTLFIRALLLEYFPVLGRLHFTSLDCFDDPPTCFSDPSFLFDVLVFIECYFLNFILRLLAGYRFVLAVATLD